MSDGNDEPLSEAQELLKRLKEKSEQSKAAAAAGLSTTSILSSLSFKDRPATISSGGREGGGDRVGGSSGGPPLPPPPAAAYRSGVSTGGAVDLLPVSMPPHVGEPPEDEGTDATTITTSTKVVLRNGLSGCCLSVASFDQTRQLWGPRPLAGDGNNDNKSGIGTRSGPRHSPFNAASAAGGTSGGPLPSRYPAMAEGFGFGDSHECLTLSNRHASSSGVSSSSMGSGKITTLLPIRYGDRVMLRSRAAREKCLSAPSPTKLSSSLSAGGGGGAEGGHPPQQSLSATTDLMFERNLGGKAEDWEVLPAALGPSDTPGFALVGRKDRDQIRRVMSKASPNSAFSSSSGGTGGSGGSWLEEHESRAVAGQCVRAGDRIALRSVLSGEFLALDYSSNSPDAAADASSPSSAGGRMGGGQRTWQVATARTGVVANEATTWTVGVAGTPFLPPWSERRPYLSGNFLLKPQRHQLLRASSSSSSSESLPGGVAGGGGGGGAYGYGNAPLRILEQLFGPQPALAKQMSSSSSSSQTQAAAEDEAAAAASLSLPPTPTLQETAAPLGSFPSAVQELLLLEDLLSVFMGLEGKYIHVLDPAAAAGSNGGDGAQGGNSSSSNNNPSLLLRSVTFGCPTTSAAASAASSRRGGGSGGFTGCCEGMDLSLAQQVERMTPLGSTYVRVKAFAHTKTQRHEHGMVAHALGAAMKVLLKEYLVLVAQLEHQLRRERLSLQKLWFFVQPALHTLTVLNSVCDACSPAAPPSSSSPSSSSPYSPSPTFANTTPPHPTTATTDGGGGGGGGACVGGELLNRLHALAERGGDDKSSEVLSFLLAKAAAPYLEMLRRWVYEGVLEDPYREFMVAEDDDESNSSKALVSEDFTTAYWERRYTLRAQQVPAFLVRSADKVLTTGKYLNVVRECGVDIVCPDAFAHFAAASPHNKQHDPSSSSSSSSFSSAATAVTAATAGGGGGLGGGAILGEAAYEEVVERAFRFASQTLLQVLFKEQKLVERLRSMKHYFLMDQGDLYVNFMDLADSELRQEMSKVSVQRVEALLQLAVQTSCCGTTDAFKDDLTCDFAPFSMIQHLEAIHSKDGSISNSAGAGGGRSSSKSMGGGGSSLKGIEVFMLDYKVSWPVSLVVSKRSVTKYQLIFRHLFFARHVERCLKQTWEGQQALKELSGVRGAGGRSYCLRHRMLGFMQSIVYYMTYEVVEPRWHEMELKLRHNCETIDEVLLAHSELQDTILKECLLTSQELLKILTKIMTICLLFAEQMNRFFEANRLRDAQAEQPPSAGLSGPFSPSVAAANDARAALLSSANKGASGSFKERNPLALNHGEEAGERGGTESHGSMGALPVGVEGTGRGDSTAIRNARIADKSAAIKAELELPSYVKMIFSYEKNFDQLLREFMGRLAKSARFQSNSHLANLVTRLDYNGFFSQTSSSPPSAASSS